MAHVHIYGIYSAFADLHMEESMCEWPPFLRLLTPPPEPSLAPAAILVIVIHVCVCDLLMFFGIIQYIFD